jgi:hypothetical protein
MLTRRTFGMGMTAVAGDKLRRPLNAPPAGNAAPGVQPGATGGVFFGRLVVIFGPAGSRLGLFLYTAGTTPGPGNPPIASITNASVDPYGNATHPGITSQIPGGAFASLLNGAILFTGGSEIIGAANGNLNATAPGPDGFSVLGGPLTSVAGTPAAPSLITTDAANSVAPPANFTGSIEYQLLPTGMVSVDVRLAVAAAAAAGIVNLAALGAAYQPARDQRGPVGWFPNGAPTLAQLTAIGQMRWEVTTAGALNLLAFTGGAAGSGVTELDFTITYPLT